MVRHLAALLVATTSACTPLHYVASTPPRASAPVHGVDGGSARATLVSAEAHPMTVTTRYRLITHAPAGVRLGMVYLTHAYQPQCAGGVNAVLMRIDGADRWQGEPVAFDGRHELEVDFVGAPDIGISGPRAIDIELFHAEKPQCFRLALRQSAAPEAGWTQTNTGDQAFAVDGNIPFHAVAGVTAAIAFRYELGVWAGPVRLAAQPGPIGLASCSVAVCGRSANGQNEWGPLIPFGASATTYPWVTGMFALGVEARIRESLVWLPREGGTERLLIHSPQGVIHFGLVSPSGGDGFPGGPRVLSADLEVPLGAIIVRRDGETLSAPMLGVGVSIHTWL
jgi:hypothetical protein